ncbi:MAG TPA: hypothetical protein VLV31_13195 [Candidatus Acidoferrales bacterium]|nr:hypothetical protein [Candidatus Acidoferrales bacterium]
MPRPIETLLSLPRVRLVDKVPILETEKFVRRFITRIDFRPRLVKPSLEVSQNSAKQFSQDDRSLSALLAELDSAEYIVTKRSKGVMENMLRGVCEDGVVFKGFEEKIQPLCEISQPLREASGLAGNLADKAKEDSLDVARALLIDLPTPKRQNT